MVGASLLAKNDNAVEQGSVTVGRMATGMVRTLPHAFARITFFNDLAFMGGFT